MNIACENRTLTSWKLILSVAAVVATTTAAPVFANESVGKKQSGQAAAADTTEMKLRGGEEGTLFESLRVEGEDRVRIRFERPALHLLLDTGSAPGLEWKSVQDVIDRIGVDQLRPYLARSAGQRPFCYTRPWLDTFSTDAVARFRPAIEGVDRWRLLVADSKGDTVASFAGKGKPPKEIAWDGRSLKGGYVAPGLVYSYVLEAYDRAGNKRNFVGEGFEIPCYRVEDDEVHTMLFSGAELVPKTADYGTAAPPPVTLLEVASWVNQGKDLEAPVRIEITAREFREANYLADEIARRLTPLLLGNPLRVQTVTKVEPDAPERGTVAVIAHD
jgi:hypothetical protein